MKHRIILDYVIATNPHFVILELCGPQFSGKISDKIPLFGPWKDRWWAIEYGGEISSLGKDGKIHLEHVCYVWYIYIHIHHIGFIPIIINRWCIYVCYVSSGNDHPYHTYMLCYVELHHLYNHIIPTENHRKIIG